MDSRKRWKRILFLLCQIFGIVELGHAIDLDDVTIDIISNNGNVPVGVCPVNSTCVDPTILQSAILPAPPVGDDPSDLTCAEAIAGNQGPCAYTCTANVAGPFCSIGGAITMNASSCFTSDQTLGRIVVGSCAAGQACCCDPTSVPAHPATEPTTGANCINPVTTGTCVGNDCTATAGGCRLFYEPALADTCNVEVQAFTYSVDPATGTLNTTFELRNLAAFSRDVDLEVFACRCPERAGNATLGTDPVCLGYLPGAVPAGPIVWNPATPPPNCQSVRTQTVTLTAAGTGSASNFQAAVSQVVGPDVCGLVGTFLRVRSVAGDTSCAATVAASAADLCVDCAAGGCNEDAGLRNREAAGPSSLSASTQAVDIADTNKLLRARANATTYVACTSLASAPTATQSSFRVKSGGTTFALGLL